MPIAEHEKPNVRDGRASDPLGSVLEMGVAQLDRRTPGASLPPQAYRAVGVARAAYAEPATRWSSDDATLERLARALGVDCTRQWQAEAAT